MEALRTQNAPNAKVSSLLLMFRVMCVDRFLTTPRRAIHESHEITLNEGQAKFDYLLFT
jgi:hypothetical protein